MFRHTSALGPWEGEISQCSKYCLVSEVTTEECFLPSGISSWSQVGVNTGINANEVSRLSPSDSFFFYPSSTISFSYCLEYFLSSHLNLKDFIWRRGNSWQYLSSVLPQTPTIHYCISVALSKTSSGFLPLLPWSYLWAIMGTNEKSLGSRVTSK